MCGHNWQKVNDAWICNKCGFTRLPNGQVLFDKKYPAVIKRKQGKRSNKL